MGFEFYILLGFFVVLFSLGLVGMALSVRYKHTPIAQPALPDTVQGNPEAGNVFFAIFGALALVGILGAATMTFMKGPLSSAIKLTKLNTAEVQMTVGSQVAVMSTTSQANSGDCDSDGFVEPMDWRAATTEPIPTNGGLIPLSLGISKKDPWGTEYGYCVWNHGPTTSGGTCGANMLTGTNSTAYPVVALVSAGPDKAFTTTCRSFASADGNSDGDLDDAGDDPLVSKAAETDDDVIHTFTYEEATAASGGLWSLKSGDPATAVIDKKIETTGTASLAGGVLLPDSSLITCDATTAGVMAKNASGTGIEICDGTGSWTSISGGSGTANSFANSSAICDSTTAGQVRYNSSTTQPEFCNGTSWTPFALSSPTGSLIVLPASNYSMDITGPCSGGDCPYKYGSWITFTASNVGLTATPVLSVPTITGANASNFEIDTGASTCDNGLALAPSGSSGSSCTIVLRAKANGNTSYSAQINVAAGALTATVPLYGVSTGFSCGSGTLGWGGIVVGACSGSGGTEPGTNQIIIQEGGCQSSTFEPTCSGTSSSDPQFIFAAQSFVPNGSNTSSGAQNDVNLTGYYGYYPAAEYCRNLVKNGYTDWFLPSLSELQSFYSDTVIRPLFASGQYYWSSTYNWTDNYYGNLTDAFSVAIVSTNSTTSSFVNNALKTRCIRKHNSVAPSLVPDSPTFQYSGGSLFTSLSSISTTYTPNLSASVTSSSPLKILSHNSNLSISVSGTGTPQYRLNGGAWQSSGTISPGINQIEFSVTSPATYGAERAITINIGGISGTWRVRTYDSSVTKNIFVTSTSYQGNLGGVIGANNICRTRAQFAGLSGYGTYQALISSNSNSPLDNIGWNWGALQNTGGQTVATNPGTFSSLSLSGPANRNEFGAITTSSNVWTGAYQYLTVADGSYTCSNWTTSGAGSSGLTGAPASLSSSFIWTGSSISCNNSYPLYCVGPNPDLPNITCPGTIDATASKNGAGSYSVTVYAGCTVQFKLWGGAGSNIDCWGSGGGGGGYAYFTETPATNTTYYYTVGGGASGITGGGSEAGFSGGTGGSNTTISCAHGGGGGATVLRRNSASGPILAVAGGGGGERKTTCGGQSSSDYAGGAGTFSTTSTAGEAGITGANGSPGGGGGYDGASGGGGRAIDNTVGNGGSNWIDPGYGSTAAGTGGTPGNASDTHKSSLGWSSIGTPGCSNGNAGGVIVIY